MRVSVDTDGGEGKTLGETASGEAALGGTVLRKETGESEATAELWTASDCFDCVAESVAVSDPFFGCLRT